MLSKAHLTSHSKMSGSRWVITLSWLSGSWRSFLYSSSVYSCQQIWKTQQRPQDTKRSVFIPIPKKGNAKESSNYHIIALISVAQMVKASAYNAGDLAWIPWLGRSPGERKWQPTPVSLPGKSHGWRSLAGYSPWGRKESDMTEQCLIVFYI